MLKITLDDKSGKSEIMATGSGEDIVAELLFCIAEIYSKFHRSNPAFGRAFREKILTAMLMPNSPVWDGEGASEGILFCFPHHKEED